MAVTHRFGPGKLLPILLATALLALLLAIAGHWRTTIKPPTSVIVSGVLLVGAAVGSVLFNDQVPLSNLVLLASHLALFWVGWCLSTEVIARRLLLAGLTACMLMVAIYAVVQFYRWDPLPPDPKFPDRILSVFQNPNHFGNFMAVGLSMALASLMKAVTRTTTLFWQLVCALIYAGLLMSGSRGAWVAAFVGFAIVVTGHMVLYRRRSIPLRPAMLCCTAVLLAVVTVLVSRRPVLTRPTGPVTVAQRVLSTTKIVGPPEKRDATMNHRYFIWRTAGRMIAAAPMLGHGYGNFAYTFATFRDDPTTAARLARLKWSQRHDPTAYAHNELLHTWVEIGLLGLLGFLGLNLAAVARVWSRLRSHAEGLHYWGAIAALGAILVHGMVSYPLRLPLNGSIFWILLGIIIGFSQSRGAAQEN